MTSVTRSTTQARLRWLFASALTLAAAIAMAKSPQALHVISHNNAKVITDPSKGWNAYPSWVVFPSADAEYRKIVLWVTYRCPDSLHCGEWDYIDNVWLRRTGGASGKRHNLELARLISPYGWRFDSTWSFTWRLEITDFSFLLHDSCEIEFIHTGYEANNDRGWLVTLDFEIQFGKPAMQGLALDTLWNGSFSYGDSAKPVDSLLRPIAVKPPAGAEIARLRIVQTGHGMDDFENCAEFCSKWREILVNDSVINRRQIWKRCGDNPLYPQAGTWLFDRANWCPGSIVEADQYDFRVSPGIARNVGIRLEPYLNHSKPTANYYIQSYLIYMTKPWAEHDVSLEEIIAPNRRDEFSRRNPICANPAILIKNNGSQVVKNLKVKFGETSKSSKTVDWSGEIAPQQSREVVLPGVELPAGAASFYVRLESPNGKRDEYPDDNEQTVALSEVPSYASRLILSLRTNADTAQNYYELRNSRGEIARERRLGSLAPNTSYRDTFDLADGCYELVVADTMGDGLDFWFNPEGGYGFVRLLDAQGRLLKAFNSDFGSIIRHSFRVSNDAPSSLPPAKLPLVNPFPARNRGVFTVEIFQNEPLDLTMRIVPEDTSRVVFEQSYSGVKEAFLPVDISKEPDGRYLIRVSSGGQTITRGIRIKHQD